MALGSSSHPPARPLTHPPSLRCLVPTSCSLLAGVYTRNRAFRLLLSSKFGKDAHLTPTRRWASLRMTTKQLFFASLISWVDGGGSSSHSAASKRPLLLSLPTGVGTIGADAATSAAFVVARRLEEGIPADWRRLLMAWPCAAGVVAPRDPAAGGAGGCGTSATRGPDAAPGGRASGACFCAAQAAPSPYAGLEAFITSRCQQVRSAAGALCRARARPPTQGRPSWLLSPQPLREGRLPPPTIGVRHVGRWRLRREACKGTCAPGPTASSSKSCSACGGTDGVATLAEPTGATAST